VDGEEDPNPHDKVGPGRNVPFGGDRRGHFVMDPGSQDNCVCYKAMTTKPVVISGLHVGKCNCQLPDNEVDCCPVTPEEVHYG
jgi:hypothetical protein